jgi:hypothetical protein
MNNRLAGMDVDGDVSNIINTPIAFSIPNVDTYIAPFTFCPKEVLQKSYIDMIGKKVNFCGVDRIVKNVMIDEANIIVQLV